MVLMILNVSVSIHSKNTIVLLVNVPEVTVNNAQGLQVLGHVRVGRSLVSIKQLLKPITKESKTVG